MRYLSPGYHFPAGMHVPLRCDLLATDFKQMCIKFEDGSVWQVAALVAQEGAFDVVYTEHLGYHVFHRGTIYSVMEAAH